MLTRLISFQFLWPGDACVAEEKGADRRGGVSEAVQQQEHEGSPGQAQQGPGSGHEVAACRFAGRVAQSMSLF